MSPLGVLRPPAAVREAPRILACAPPPASRAAPGRPTTGAPPSSAQRGAEQALSPVRASREQQPRRPGEPERFPPGPDPAGHAQCASWNPALPGPGSVLRVFAAAEGALRGGWETVSALFLAPSLARGCGRPHRKMRTNRGWGRGSARHALPLGLLRVISRNSVQRGERRGRRREGQRRRERRKACKTGRSALESLKHERDNRLGIIQATVIPESSRRLTITPTLTFPTRS